jgi:hypothetical protein
MDFFGLEITDHQTSAGTEGNAQSSKRAYARTNRFYDIFLADFDSLNVDVVSKDSYLPDQSDHVNCELICYFILWYIKKTSPTKGHVREALMFLQRKLADATNLVGFIPRKGWIRKDPWIETFTKGMLV